MRGCQAIPFKQTERNIARCCAKRKEARRSGATILARSGARVVTRLETSVASGSEKQTQDLQHIPASEHWPGCGSTTPQPAPAAPTPSLGGGLSGHNPGNKPPRETTIGALSTLSDLGSSILTRAPHLFTLSAPRTPTGTAGATATSPILRLLLARIWEELTPGRLLTG